VLRHWEVVIRTKCGTFGDIGVYLLMGIKLLPLPEVELS
jgi:hypothetical protein